MTLVVLTIFEDWRTNKETIKGRWTVEGDTIEDCFKAAYPTERSYRYCSDTNIRFENPEVHQQYLKWKRYGVTPALFYGNATVD
jgi:hypothetical protein